jgi:hypothetical protein
MMIYQCESCFDPHLVAKILEYVTIELLGIVNCYIFSHSEMTYYVLLEKSHKPRCCDGD